MSRVHTIPMKDEEGRTVVFSVQVDEKAGRISCWYEGSEGGSISLPQLFAACVKETASR